MEEAYIHDYAIQLGDIWMVIPLLVALGFGVWKLAKLLWTPFSS